MKATGIVRRIDDLGRVVIPKEIRRNLRISDGDALEIFTTTEGDIIFRKYRPYGEKDWAKAYAIAKAIFAGAHFGLYDAGEIVQQRSHPSIPRELEEIGTTHQAIPLKDGYDTIGYLVVEMPANDDKVQMVTNALTAFFQE